VNVVLVQLNERFEFLILNTYIFHQVKRKKHFVFSSEWLKEEEKAKKRN
jgi:hypothetical protein